ncbi:serine/threonine-protein kinase [Actinomadura physcomitrii]|uniref:serine/threonine-protein kinase n=1 Tax=Actinomadura physcomitrii TaxID=2650748 RepID=UPI0019245C34|nr:serine/threonine-protein kinase [Actinomadura physcomitrii]
MVRRDAPLGPLEAGDPAAAGPYTLLGRLGSGSMGRVYLGCSAAGRLVAVKTVRAELAREADFRTRFAHEAAAARRVSGVYTASVVNADPDAEVPWLATAYVPAPSLELLVAEAGPLPVAAVRWLAGGCAEALESIHAAGLVHRDLKPSNVLVCADGPRVIDFGLAHARERARVTLSRVAVGTPAFMAPEQAQGSRVVTAASDVYALGATLLYAATGHGPYRGEGALELMAQLATLPPDLSGLAVELETMVRGCLARDPARRPAPADVLASVSDYLRHGRAEPGLSGSALDLVRDYAAGPRLPVGGPDRAGAAPERPMRERPRVVIEGVRDGRSSSSPARTFLREPRNTIASVAAILLIGVGALLARTFWSGGGSAGADPGRGRPPAGRAAEPPAPLGGAGDRPTGDPRIVVNQPQGDGVTVFVIHGTGWRPGDRVRVSLDGSGERPGPVVDHMGTFNYAVNQAHEFLPGPLPLGVHTFAAATGGAPARTTFRVVP